MENRFMQLVKENGGFEYVLGFINDVDHFIGGVDDKLWYFIDDGKKQECWMASYAGDSWKDYHYVVKGEKVTKEEIEPGTTMGMILERAYFYQKEIEESGRKPAMTEVRSYPVRHYTYAFGERAYDISDEYGVTVCYSYINDESVGFRVRDIKVGESVTAPDLQ